MNPNAVKAFEVIDLNRLGVKIKFAALCSLPKSLQSIPKLMVLSQDSDLLEATINKHFIDAGCLIDSLTTVFNKELDIYSLLYLYVSNKVAPIKWKSIFNDKGNFTNTGQKEIDEIAEILALSNYKKERLKNIVNSYHQTLVIRANPKLI